MTFEDDERDRGWTIPTLRVLRNNPGENNDGEVLEEFTNLSFDPDNINYLPRAIGDRYVTIDTNGKLTYNGDYPNKSRFVRVEVFKQTPNYLDENGDLPSPEFSASLPAVGSGSPYNASQGGGGYSNVQA